MSPWPLTPYDGGGTSADPTETWRATFAVRDRTALAETQAALAKSQQDLTAMEQQRDEARAEAREWRAIADKHLSQRDEALHDLAHAKFALSMANTRLAHWKEQAESALGRLNEMEKP